jgi:hypothetical protein
MAEARVVARVVAWAGPGGFERGGLGGFDLRELMQAGANANVDSLLSAFAVNPMQRVLALEDSLQLTPEQTTALTALSDTLTAQLTLHKTALKPMVENLLTSLRDRGQGGRLPGGQVMQEVQLQIQPQLQAARRETGEAMRGASSSARHSGPSCRRTGERRRRRPAGFTPWR